MSSAIRYARNSKILAAELSADETALLSAERGKYFGLNSPAARVWSLLVQPSTLAEVCAALTEEFDVDPAVCERDTAELVAEMLQEGLLEKV